MTKPFPLTSFDLQALLSNFEHKEWFEVLQQPDKLQSVDSLLASLAMQQRLEHGSVVGSFRDESIFLEDVLAHQQTGLPLCLPNDLGDVAEDEVEELLDETYEDGEDEGVDEEEEMDDEEQMDFDP